MIKFNQVSKSYNDRQALKNVSFQVQKGEFFGLLGPNGAGKTTTLNILSTLIRPDHGEVLIDGLSLGENLKDIKHRIGIVPQEIALYEELSAFENLMFWGSLYDMPKAQIKTKALEVLEMVGLLDRRGDLIKTFSGGMKRRINIASALLHAPKVLLLDEPTAGVDPQSRNHIFELLENLNQAGITVIYTTHYMEEVERLCDTIGIIDSGQIAAQGSLEELRRVSEAKDIIVLNTEEVTKTSFDELSNHTAFVLEEDATKLTIECENIGNEISGLINHINNAKITIKSIETHQADLESIFLKLTGKQLRD